MLLALHQCADLLGQLAWLLPVREGLCIRFRRGTQSVPALLPSKGDSFIVEMLPKLASLRCGTAPRIAALLRLANVES